MSKEIGKVTVDIAEHVSRRPFFISVRYKGRRRAQLALWILIGATYLARRLGVAVYVTTNEWVRAQHAPPRVLRHD